MPDRCLLRIGQAERQKLDRLLAGQVQAASAGGKDGQMGRGLHQRGDRARRPGGDLFQIVQNQQGPGLCLKKFGDLCQRIGSRRRCQIQPPRNGLQEPFAVPQVGKGDKPDRPVGPAARRFDRKPCLAVSSAADQRYQARLSGGKKLGQFRLFGLSAQEMGQINGNALGKFGQCREGR